MGGNVQADYAAVRERSAERIVRALAWGSHRAAGENVSRATPGRDDLPDNAVPCAPRRRPLARHPYHARLWKLARAAGSLRADGLGTRRYAGGQYFVRRASGKRCAVACLGAFVRAAVEAIRRAAGGGKREAGGGRRDKLALLVGA